MDIVPDFLATFSHRRNEYEKIREEVEMLCKEKLHGIHFLWESRVKALESLETKLRNRSKQYTTKADIFADIKDLVGGRIILTRCKDFLTVAKMVTENFDLKTETQHPKSEVALKTMTSSRRFREYDGHHFCVTQRNKQDSDVVIEIQVMTAFTWVFAAREHDVTYKPQSGLVDKRLVSYIEIGKGLANLGGAWLEDLDDFEDRLDSDFQNRRPQQHDVTPDSKTTIENLGAEIARKIVTQLEDRERSKRPASSDEGTFDENDRIFLQDLFNQFLSRTEAQVATLFTELGASRQLEILQWISPIAYKDCHRSAGSGRTEGTGQWLLTHAKFCTWRESIPSAMLWLHGSPGAGKTKLVSTVIDEQLRNIPRSPTHGALAYFYCDRDQNPTSIISSFVRQLSISQDENSVQSSSVQVYDEKRKSGFASNQLSFEEAQTQLHKLIQIYPRTTLILDALDECEKDSRITLVQFLHGLIGRSSTPIKIFISSRPDVDLRLEFEHGPNLEITAQDNHDDIIKHVESTITSSVSPRFWRSEISKELRQRVYDTLVSNSGGMFLWVCLQISELHALDRERDISLRLERLGDLPKTLETAYGEIFARIKRGGGSAPEIASRAFQWILCSKEPMSPADLVAAVCQDPTTDDVDNVDIDTDFVLKSCQNLLKFEPTHQPVVCRFSHVSVREYLESHQWSLVQTNSLVSEVCLIMLNDPEQQRWLALHADPLFQDKRNANYEEHQNNPTENLSLYACLHWMTHIQRCTEGGVDERLVILLKKFFGSPEESAQAYRKWHHATKSLNVRDSYRSLTLSGNTMKHLEPSSLSSLPIALFELQEILQDWWNAITPEERNSEGDTLLVLAAHGNCLSTVQSLLDKGADINAYDSKSKLGTALHAASRMGYDAVARLLVERGADVNSTCGSHGSALGAASRNGGEHLVRLLIEKGANINAQVGFYGTALQVALWNRAEVVVRLLLDKGADVNAQGGVHGNPLQAASQYGLEAVVRRLLKEGADVNARGGYYDNALLAASNNGHPLVVELLLEKGAKDWNGMALEHAAAEGWVAITKLLLKYSNVGLEGALVAACYNTLNVDTVVTLLFEAGAFDHDGKAMGAAAKVGCDSAMRILLDRRLDRSTSFIGRALELACEDDLMKTDKKVERTVRLLLDAGAIDQDGKAMRAAAAAGYGLAMTMLLGKSTSFIDEALESACEERSSLYWKETWSVHTVVKVLLDAGAVDHRGVALQKAVHYTWDRAADLLREAAKKRCGREGVLCGMCSKCSEVMDVAKNKIDEEEPRACGSETSGQQQAPRRKRGFSQMSP